MKNVLPVSLLFSVLISALSGYGNILNSVISMRHFLLLYHLQQLANVKGPSTTDS